MSLSSINPTPLYDCVVPSSKKKIKFRPFFVKEERALLAAQESEDVNVMLNTLNQIVKNCVEPKTICDSLTIFDIEYLFIKIRSKSVDEFSNIIVTCDSCKKQSPYRISLEEVNVVTPPEHTTSIKISGDIVVMMKYPTIEELMEIENNDAISSLDSEIYAVKSAIKSVYVGDEVYHISEESPGEVMTFINKLSHKQYEKLKGFLDTMPETQVKIEWKCPECGHMNSNTLSGINNFF